MKGVKASLEVCRAMLVLGGTEHPNFLWSRNSMIKLQICGVWGAAYMNFCIALWRARRRSKSYKTTPIDTSFSRETAVIRSLLSPNKWTSYLGSIVTINYIRQCNNYQKWAIKIWNIYRPKMLKIISNNFRIPELKRFNKRMKRCLTFSN